MLALHCYSNAVELRLETIDEEEDEYSLDEIKEFEAVNPAWQETLNALLQGSSRSRSLAHSDGRSVRFSARQFNSARVFLCRRR